MEAGGENSTQAGTDVDLLKDLALVLDPLDVEADCREQDRADRSRRQAAVGAELNQSVDQQEDDRRPHQRAADGAATAAQADAAEHDGGKRIHLPADAGIGAGAVLTRRIKNAGQRRQHAGQHVGEKQRVLDVDTGVARGLPARADRHDVDAGADTREIEVRNHPDDDEAEHIDGNSKQKSRTQEIPGRTVGGCTGKLRRKGAGDLVVGCAQDDQHHHGRQEGTRLGIGNQSAVDRTDQRAPTKYGDDRQRQRPVAHLHEIQRQEISHREDGTDRQIDPARQDRDRHRHRHEGLLGEAAHQLLQLGERGVSGNGQDENDEDQNQQCERNDRLHPSLFEQLADQKLRRVTIPETS